MAPAHMRLFHMKMDDAAPELESSVERVRHPIR
jgi:hypothetical protein